MAGKENEKLREGVKEEGKGGIEEKQGRPGVERSSPAAAMELP